MAEKVLYNNPTEPSFPFEAVIEHILWVPGFIAGLTLDRGRMNEHSIRYESLIDTLLVFSRARTAALLPICELKAIKVFARRLNQILQAVGGERHFLEISLFDRSRFFVTTKHSPRFHWGLSLTHRQIGLNLDYFAAGHCNDLTLTNLVSAHIVEYSTGSLIDVSSELAYVDYLSLRELAAFNSFIIKKRDLYNDSMNQLGLPYQFDRYMWEPETDAEIRQTMRSDSPPSIDWWKDHYCQLRYMDAMIYCSRYTRIDIYWPLLKLMWEWAEENALTPIALRDDEYRIRMEELFRVVREGMDKMEDMGCLLDQATDLITELGKKQSIVLAARPRDPYKLSKLEYQILHSIQLSWRRISLQTYKKGKGMYQLEFKGIVKWPEAGNLNVRIKRGRCMLWKTLHSCIAQ